MTTFKAVIFQKNVARKSSESSLVEKFNNCFVDIDNKKLKVYNDSVTFIDTELNFKERDFHTETYTGKFKDEWLSFRVIRPIDIALVNICNEHNCLSAFSIASESPTGYAIHFILVDKNESRNINTIEKGKNEQIEKLLEGCILALQNQLHGNFIDYTKRILSLVEKASEIERYNYGTQVIEIMKKISQVYSNEEMIKLMQ